MKIRKMTATFGALHRAVLIPEEGLTVIAAPNESGKSTWAAFLKAMLYGIDTRDRDKAGYLADKNRYQPWSGAPMSGELELEWEGREITLRRTSGRSGPMQQFEAVYTATGDPVPGLTAANVGQTLLGVGKDVFERSALVGQNAAVITAVPELERRIAALATSGEEGVSASAAQRTLKDWRNRRRANRANGQIPELEGQIREVENSLSELSAAGQQKKEAELHLDELNELCRQLEEERELHRRLAQKELNRRCGEAQLRLEEAENRLRELPPPDPQFAGMTAAEAEEKEELLEYAADEMARLQARAPEYEQKKRSLQKLRRIAAIGLPVACAVGVVLALAGILVQMPGLAYAGGGIMAVSAIFAAVAVTVLRRKSKDLRALEEILAAVKPVEVPDASGYIRWLADKASREQEVRHCRERLEDLLAQGAQPLNTLELLPVPSGTAEQTEARLAAARRDMALWQSRLDRAIGALREDPLVLEARRAGLEEELARRTAQYDALDLAMEVLEDANVQLRERFSPLLNQEAAALFSRLTGGKYTSLAFSRDFSAAAGGEERHSALYLSAGTVDQLYLAARLALCRLTVPEAPLLLDDALCAFDDRRMELALETLRDMGRERQILLFSCHSREARWAEGAGVPVIRL